MKFVANQPDGEFASPEPGTCIAALTGLIDLGTEPASNPEFTARRRLMMRWELDQEMKDGRRFIVNQWASVSFHERSKLRGIMESWRGRAYKPGEVMNPKAALGRSAMVNVVINDRGYADIASVSPLPKKMEPLEPAGALLYWDMDEPDWDVWDQLSERLQERIQRTPEFQAIDQGGTPPAAQSAPQKRADNPMRAQADMAKQRQQAAAEVDLDADAFDDAIPF